MGSWGGLGPHSSNTSWASHKLQTLRSRGPGPGRGVRGPPFPHCTGEPGLQQGYLPPPTLTSAGLPLAPPSLLASPRRQPHSPPPVLHTPQVVAPATLGRPGGVSAREPLLMLRVSSSSIWKCLCRQSSRLGVCRLQIRAQGSFGGQTQRTGAECILSTQPLPPAHPSLSSGPSGGSGQGHGAALKSGLPGEPSSRLSALWLLANP